MTKKKKTKKSNDIATKPLKAGEVVNDNPNINPPPGVTVKQTTTVKASYHEGPIPSADQLKKYEDICPGAARDILNMAIKQNDHQITTEIKVIDRSFNNLKRGQNFAFGSMIVGGVLSGLAIFYGMPIVAGAVFGLPTAAIIGVFITNKRHKPAEIEKKETSPSEQKSPN